MDVDIGLGQVVHSTMEQAAEIKEVRREMRLLHPGCPQAAHGSVECSQHVAEVCSGAANAVDVVQEDGGPGRVSNARKSCQRKESFAEVEEEPLLAPLGRSRCPRRKAGNGKVSRCT